MDQSIHAVPTDNLAPLHTNYMYFGQALSSFENPTVISGLLFNIRNLQGVEVYRYSFVAVCATVVSLHS